MKVRIIVLAVLSAFSIAPKGMANPDIPIETLIQWSKGHLLLEPLRLVDKLKESDPDFSSQLQTSLGQVQYSAVVDSDQYVLSERIQYRPKCFETDAPGCLGAIEFYPDRPGSGTRLIELLWGNDVLQDFLNAKLMWTDSVSGKKQWYQGKSYNYETWHFGDNINTDFSIVSKRSPQAERIHQYQACLKERCQDFL